MTPLPHHVIATTTVPLAVDDADRRLRSAAAEVVTDATADAIDRLTPVLRAAGVRSHALPVVTTEVANSADPASLRLRWSGDDDATLWPAAAAAVTVSWAGPGQARLNLTTDRIRFELATGRLGAIHRRRIATLSATSFLDALTERLTAGTAEAAAGTAETFAATIAAANPAAATSRPAITVGGPR